MEVIHVYQTRETRVENMTHSGVNLRKFKVFGNRMHETQSKQKLRSKQNKINKN